VTDSPAHARPNLRRHLAQWLAKAAEPGTARSTAKAAPTWNWPGNDDAFRLRSKFWRSMQALKMIERQPDYDRLFDLRCA
jgi:hypothetical protein